jgi:hypothetical protein
LAHALGAEEAPPALSNLLMGTTLLALKLFIHRFPHFPGYVALCQSGWQREGKLNSLGPLS